MIELQNINFRYAGGNDAGGWKISTLQFQMGRYSFYVGNPAAGKPL